jgi:hypothetical protein
MRNDPRHDQVETGILSAEFPLADLDPADGLTEIGWWLTGGMSLLAWTGFALLLTGA